MVLLNSFTCLVVFFCISLRDLLVYFLRTSTCLLIFSCISLRALFLFLKLPIIIMRCDFFIRILLVLEDSVLAVMGELVLDDVK